MIFSHSSIKLLGLSNIIIAHWGGLGMLYVGLCLIQVGGVGEVEAGQGVVRRSSGFSLR
jgi:hypothetical protein